MPPTYPFSQPTHPPAQPTSSPNPPQPTQPLTQPKTTHTSTPAHCGTLSTFRQPCIWCAVGSVTFHHEEKMVFSEVTSEV